MILWAFEESSTVGWVVAGLGLATGVGATILKFQRPGKRLREAGIPTWILVVGVGAGILGFFAIPIVGGPIAFILTIYLFELRKRDGRAWGSTKTALGAIVESMGIELAGGVTIIVLLLVGIWAG